MEMESGYQRLEKQSGSRHTSCTNVWLALIFVSTFLQMVLWVGVGTMGFMFYDANKGEIQAWANLPWSSMASSVGNSYISLQKTPIGDTLGNMHTASSTVNRLLSYHEENTLKRLESFVNEAADNQNLFKHVHEASIRLLPAINSLQNALKEDKVEDLHVILDKVRHNLELLSDDDVKTVFTSTESILKTIQQTVTTDFIQGIANNIEGISSTARDTFTPSNVNKTIKLISDIDKTVTRAETTANSIGKLLGKV